MSAPIVVLTNTPTQMEALDIGEEAVASGLAAAVQVFGPSRSVYLWRGETRRTEEWVCAIKTTEGRFEKVKDLVRARHPYELPAVFAVPVVAGSEDYLAWWRSAGDPDS